MMDNGTVVYNQLRALGMPDSVTLESFLSVYTLGAGNWKDTLDSVAQRLGGRTRDTARLNGEYLFPDDRRESLYRTLGAVQKEWEIENRQLVDLDRRKKELENETEDRRKAMLLLNILEKRERFRMKRIGVIGNGESGGNVGIGDLMKKLRTEAIFNSQMFQEALIGMQNPDWDTNVSLSSSPKLPRRLGLSDKHCTNALANLHAYHCRLVHMTTRTSIGSAKDLNERIEIALKALGVRDIRDAQQRLIGVARSRAERRRKFDLGSATDLSANESHFEELQRTNKQKKEEVQQQLNRAIALGWVCEGYVDLIAAFREQTVPGLDESMAEEQKRVEGYVDKMMTAIVEQREKSKGNFSQQVREIMGTSRVRVWEELNEELQYSWPNLKMELGGQKDLVVDEMDVSDISRLLERKKQKAEYGYAMAEEVRGLLQGWRKLKYV